jgi:Acyl-CoA dehydrogenase, N-terminal domain
MASTISERESRQVAEEAREKEWRLPSFGKELFLGNFRLDLIHPQPRLDAEAVDRGDRFLAELGSFLEREVDPLEIERDARIPQRVIDGLKQLGALGMKIPQEYGGLGLSQVYYNRALALAGSVHSSLSTLPYQEFGALAEHVRYAERHSRKLARSIFYGMTRWQAGLEKRQAFLGRTVDIGAELFALASACVYARTIGREHPERAEQAVELADLFCRQARLRIDRLFTDLWSNQDDANYAAAQRLLDGRYTWLEHGIIDPSGEGPMIAEQPEQLSAR